MGINPPSLSLIAARLLDKSRSSNAVASMNVALGGLARLKDVLGGRGLLGAEPPKVRYHPLTFGLNALLARHGRQLTPVRGTYHPETVSGHQTGPTGPVRARSNLIQTRGR